jgi:predicted Rossmann-fold nucleotide-binding protein
VAGHIRSRLIDRFHCTLVIEGIISASDLDLLQCCCPPQEVINAIFDYYEHKSFEPSEQEQQ